MNTRKNSFCTGTDYREYKLSVSEWLRDGLAGLAFAAVVAYVFYRSWTAFALASPLAVVYPLLRRKERRRQRDAKLAAEFREAITILSSSLSAGFSPENAMAETETELRLIFGPEAMIVKEFAGMNHRISMNETLESVWEEFAKRSGSEDIRNFARIVAIAKRSGGELGGIITRTADTIGDKIHIENEIRTLTSGKRFEQKIMNLVPIVIVLYVDATSPGFFDGMYQGLSGRLIMTVCLAVYIAAILIAGRILEIEL